MPVVTPPIYFKGADDNANRRQDSEDAFFGALLGDPRDFVRDGVAIVANGILAASQVRLVHSLGYKARGWFVKRVERPLGSATYVPPFFRTGGENTTSAIQLFFASAGDYTVQVF